MGNYKASKNNVNEDIEQLQEEKNEQATQDVLDAGIEVAKNIPGVNVYAHAADLANKATGGALTKGASKIVNQGLKNSTMGAQAQEAINTASDSGLTDVAKKAASVKNGNVSGNAKIVGISGNSLLGGLGKFGGNSKSITDGNIMGNLTSKIPPSLKIKIYVGIGVFFFLIMIFITVFAEDDEINLGATNNTSMSPSGSVGNIPCTIEEIEDKLVYVGDSRTVGMSSSIGKDNIQYIAEVGKGYDWLTSNALSEIDSKLTDNPKSVIVLSLGVNDLHNIDNYINEYHNLINKYPDAIFYIMSVNPVDETKTSANGYNVTNSDIESFNKKLSDNFPNNYLDIYSSIGNPGTNDGLHYDNDTYNSVHNLVTDNISKYGKVMCGSSGANYLGDINKCSLTVVGDKYYKTVIPQTKECVVNGFYDNNSWGLEPSFYANIMSLIEDAKAQGCDAAIISGHRTYEKQASLYRKYLNGTGNLAAKPGYGNHEYAIAADLRYVPDNNKCVSYYHNNAAKYGLGFPLLNASQPEDWHIEPINIIKGTP